MDSPPQDKTLVHVTPTISSQPLLIFVGRNCQSFSFEIKRKNLENNRINEKHAPDLEKGVVDLRKSLVNYSEEILVIESKEMYGVRCSDLLSDFAGS